MMILATYLTGSALGREGDGNGGSCRPARIPLPLTLLVRNPSSPMEDRGTAVTVAGGDAGADTDVEVP